MTNEELKKKIVEILNDVTTEPMIYKGRYLGDTQMPELKINAIADALIAAGIGDVSSEKAMRELAEAFYREKDAECDLLDYKLRNAEHRAVVAELVVKNLNDIFTFDYQTVFEQAEKELAEEGK